MKTLLTILLLTSACTAPVTQEAAPAKDVFYQATSIVPLDVTNAPDWVQVATTEAIKFWDSHGLSFEIQVGGIPVSAGTVPEQAVGIYTFGGSIILNPELATDKMAFCTMAHEMGHSVQMMHVSNAGGMMSVHASVNSDGTCMWNNKDQAELARVLEL